LGCLTYLLRTTIFSSEVEGRGMYIYIYIMCVFRNLSFSLDSRPSFAAMPEVFNPTVNNVSRRQSLEMFVKH
jgi:hypothetical protein